MKIITTRNTAFFLIIFYTVGILGFTFSFSRQLFENLVLLNLLINAFLLFLFHKEWTLKSVLILFAVAITGFLAELIGVNTGLLFGSYSYGSNLGIKWLDTPLLIGLNWLTLVYCIWVLFGKINTKWYFPFIGSAAMVVFDLVMEPVATQTGMWNWSGNVIPLKNYASWYIVSFVLFSILCLLRPSFRNPVAKWVLLVQLVFFLSLNLIFRIV